MNDTSSTPQGMLYLGNNIIHVKNALIEKVAANTKRTGICEKSYDLLLKGLTGVDEVTGVKAEVVDDGVVMHVNGLERTVTFIQK